VNRPGPPTKYGKEVVEALKKLWLGMDQMCSKRLRAALPLWLPHWDEPLDETTRRALLAMSAATIDRRLKLFRAKYGRKRRCETKPGALLKSQIPIQGGTWDIHQPGFVEVDSVAHCGGSLQGDFIWSITLTDIFSGWTEIRAVWNKGQKGVMDALADIEKNLPFPILGFDCDNGGEFLNYHLYHYFTQRKNPVQFTRSRAYHKNDNAHVEQKNWTHVRQLFGIQRLENPQLVERINRLYRREWSELNNHYCPSMKLASKTLIGSRYHKTYDSPKTPAARLRSAGILPQIPAERNPFLLQINIDKQLKSIFHINHNTYHEPQYPNSLR
jgi:hypothetical protein